MTQLQTATSKVFKYLHLTWFHPKELKPFCWRVAFFWLVSLDHRLCQLKPRPPFGSCFSGLLVYGLLCALQFMLCACTHNAQLVKPHLLSHSVQHRSLSGWGLFIAFQVGAGQKHNLSQQQMFLLSSCFLSIMLGPKQLWNHWLLLLCKCFCRKSVSRLDTNALRHLREDLMEEVSIQFHDGGGCYT